MSDKLLESAITGGLNMWNGPILMAMVPRWQWSHINGNPHMYALQETRVPSLAWEEPLEESMAIRLSILAWRIPTDRGAWWATVHRISKSDIVHTSNPRFQALESENTQ